MKIMATLLLAGVYAFLSNPVIAAGSATVTWSHPEKYKDIRSTFQESNSQYQARVFDNLTRHIESLVQQASTDIKLKLNVTNLDLAGEVRQVGLGGNARIVKELEGAKIEFSYRLLGADGAELASGKERLDEWSVPDRVNRTQRNPNREAFEYEKRMLTNWFNDKLLGHISAS